MADEFDYSYSEDIVALLTGVSTTTMNEGEDVAIGRAISAASRAIDRVCGRFFYKNTSDAVRYYTGEDDDMLRIDDLVSITSILTDEDGDRTYERTWSSTDYDLWPYNAAEENKPYTRIYITPRGIYTFPTTAKGIKITGIFGWPTVPDDIQQACNIQTIRLYSRKNSPFGIVMGGAEAGALRIPALDPDVKRMIMPFRKVGIYG